MYLTNSNGTELIGLEIKQELSNRPEEKNGRIKKKKIWR
jgi:hypothetical protein